MQAPQLPRLPGFNFNSNIGRTKFHRSQLFDRIHGDVYYLADKPTHSQHSRYPSVYAWGEDTPQPTWLALDGQRLMFKAYFQESLHGRREPYRVRLVDISFFLEDGTMKISEPAIDNSGLDQGVLVRRQRIPLPDPVKYRYFDILDLNIGKEPEIYGRVYKIVGCDKFTRRFLNRMGIPVPDPLNAPADPLYDRQKSLPAKNYQKKPDNLANFLKYDRKVLRFYGYWDDTSRPYGYVHDLEILYYLADDTIEIFEEEPVKHGAARRSLLVKKIKIPKFFTNIEPVGGGDPLTILNVLGESTARSYYIPDNSYGKKSSSKEYYKECDLTIGAQMNVFGRKVVITDVDGFTREYYRQKYGLDDFTPMAKPRQEGDHREYRRFLPPYNGLGSYEDSLGNCFSVVPKRPKYLKDKAYCYENQDNDNRVLRFGARMLSDIPTNQDRYYVLNVYLLDNTVSIVEVASKKSGHTKCLFQKRMRVRLPGQELFSNEEPRYYEPRHFYVGTRVNLDGFKFEVETADEFTLNYMERRCGEFPKADLQLIMSKVRDHLKPVYREFLSQYSPFKSDSHSPILKLICLKEAMHKYLGDNVTEHEVITVARRYAFNEQKRLSNRREYVRALLHTQLTRFGWNELDRLEEDMHEWDRSRTGCLTRNQLYTVLRASRIPLQKELMNLLLDCFGKEGQENIEYGELLRFLNVKVDPLPPAMPVNLQEIYWTLGEKPKECTEIDWCAFLKDLDLEGELKETKEQDDKH